MNKTTTRDTDQQASGENRSTLQTKSRLSGVSVITPTNRPGYMENVFSNYLRQTYVHKELIVVLNNNSMDLHEWERRAKTYPEIRIFQLDQDVTYGECLNFAIDQSRFNYIANFDDDDYYAPAYLKRGMSVFLFHDVEVVGKKCYFVYFQGSKTLALVNPTQEFADSFTGAGSTLLFRKSVFNKLRFPSINCGPDTEFTLACIEKGIKMYSTDRYNFVYIRRSDPRTHTWQVEESDLLNACRVISHTDDYISPTTRS